MIFHKYFFNNSLRFVVCTSREMKIIQQKEYQDYLKSMPMLTSKHEIRFRKMENTFPIKENCTIDTENKGSHTGKLVKKIKKTDLPIVLNINMTDKALQKPKVTTLSLKKLKFESVIQVD